MLFEELNDQNIYDGIWACASILSFIKKVIFFLYFIRWTKHTKENGIIYTSFKYGEFEGERNGRYFTDFTEVMFEKFAKQISGLQIEKNVDHWRCERRKRWWTMVEYPDLQGKNILEIEPKYYNNLNIDGFSKMMKSPSYCYKFYWLEAIIQLIFWGGFNAKK